MSALLAVVLSMAVQDAGCTQPVKTFAQLDSAVEATRLQLADQPTSVGLRCRMAALRMQAGRYPAADSILGAVLDDDPEHVEALLTRALLLRRQYRFDEFAKILERLDSLTSRSAQARLLEGRYALDRMDFAAANTIYREILHADPGSAEARLGLAEIAFWEDRPAEAHELLEEALSIDPLLAVAHLLASRVHREAQSTDEWRTSVIRAVEVDSLFADGHAALATVLRNGGSLEGAYRHAQLAIELDPFSQDAHSYLGNGGSLIDYDSVPADPNDFDGRVGELLALGDGFLLNRRYDEASDPFHEALAMDPGNVVALMGLGAAHYHQGDYEAALGWFGQILSEHPGYGLAHYGVSYALKRMKDRVLVGLDEMRAVFAQQDAPEPPGLREVFPDYEGLDEELQKIVRLSVAPFSNYLPALAVAGATFHLLPFHKLLWQSPSKERTKGARTFDLRLWDDVKGQGGFHAVGGEEWVRDVRIQRWNVVTHEFTHQVHGMFPDDLRAEIVRLFQAAKAERRTLDYYADFNEMEYLAQAAEAFISEVKFIDQRGTSKHTRASLGARDPSLFEFLGRVNARDGYRDVEVRAYRQKGNTLIGDGDVVAAAAAARKALERYGDHPDLLDLLARTYRIEGDYAAARRLHRESIETFPEAIVGFTGLAEDVVLEERDHEHASELLWTAAEKHPESAELQIRFASVQFAAGELDRMDAALDSALRIEESPNPYAGTADPWILRARARMLKEDYEGAEQAYRHSIENINRQNPSAWADLALIQLRTGRAEEGREALATAELLDPEAVRVREVASDFAVHDGDTATAQRLLEQVLEVDELRLGTMVKLSELLDALDPDASRALLDRGLQMVEDPAPVDFVIRDDRFVPRGAFDQSTASRTYTRAGVVAERDGDLGRAAALHERAVEVFRFNFASGVALVRVWVANGQVADARRELERLEGVGAPSRYLAEARALLERVPSEGRQARHFDVRLRPS